MTNLLKTLALIIIISFNSCKKDSPETSGADGITFDSYTIQLLDFISSSEGWIFVEENGQQDSYKLLHSTDGFENYTVICENIPRFRKMKFIDNKVGYGISWDGSDKTYYTNDGGATWQNFTIPANDQEGSESYDITYNDTYFVMPYKKENSSYQLVAGIRFFKRSDFTFDHKVLFDTEAGKLYGGSSGTDTHYSSVHVANSGNVCFTGVFKVVASEDEDKSYGGYSTDGANLTLVEIFGKKQKPERTFFSSDNTGFYTMEDDANLYKTTNGGETWTSAYTFDDASKYKKISFADDNNGAVLVGKTKLYITKDGGATFESSSINGKYTEINEVDFVDAGNIFVSVISVDDGISKQKLLKISN